MVELRVPHDQLVERHGNYEIWIGHKILPQVVDGRDMTPSQYRRTMVVYSVRRKLTTGLLRILADNLETKGVAMETLRTLTTFERL